MKSLIISAFLVLLLSTTIVSAQWGRGNCRRGNMQNAANISRNYDVQTVKTISGEIREITYNQHGRTSGVHLAVITEDGEMEAHLGPDYAYEKQNINLKQGDKVTLTGSIVDYNDGKAMSVAVVKLNDKEYIFRNENGVPVWSGNGSKGRGARGKGWGNRRI